MQKCVTSVHVEGVRCLHSHQNIDTAHHQYPPRAILVLDVTISEEVLLKIVRLIRALAICTMKYARGYSGYGFT
eukprot:UN00369